MKKGDAAVHAEFFMKQNRWVPAWLQSPQPDAKDSTDTDTDNAAIARPDKDSRPTGRQ